MKQITILLSSVLTLLFIISNASAAAYIKFDGMQAQQPNKNSSGRFMPKQNRLGDDITTYGYKNILKKGNVFRGNVRMLPNRNSGGRFNPISKYSISDEPSFIPKPNRGSYTDSGRVTYIRSDKDGFIGETGLIGENGKVGIDVGPVFKDGFYNDYSEPAISNEQAIMTRPYRLGEDVGSGTPLKGGSSSWRDSGKVEVENSRQNWGYRVNERKFIGTAGKDGLHNNGAFRAGKVGYTECDEKGGVRAVDCPKGGIQAGKDMFIGEAGLIGENGKVGLSVGPIGKKNSTWKVEEGEAIDKPSPKGVQLKFINGEWR